MTAPSPLWPARLHHIKITSDQPAVLLDFYQGALEIEAEELTDGEWQLGHGERRLLVGRGKRNALAYAAFAIEDEDRLSAFRAHAVEQGIEALPCPSPLFQEDGFAVADPDGNITAFGRPKESAVQPDRLPGRLQHAVVGSPQPEAVRDFWLKLGFELSDEVKNDEGKPTAIFVRSDEEHHSLATFRTTSPRFDHFCMETSSWNDIRDWADHLGRLRIKLGWGPGRHGPGDNLFFMIADADGNMIELSAELERMERGTPARLWPHEERTLNQWGGAWMRS